MILVDTNVWSLAFRQRGARSSAEEALVEQMRILIDTGDAALIGAVRQEVLSGLKTAEQFERLRELLDGFTIVEVRTSTHDIAAQSYSRCRARGIAADGIDMMLCAAAIENSLSILTMDSDFRRYALALPIMLM